VAENLNLNIHFSNKIKKIRLYRCPSGIPMLLALILNIFVFSSAHSVMEIEGGDFFKSEVRRAVSLLPNHFFDQINRISIKEGQLDQELDENSDLCRLNEKVILGQLKKRRNIFEITINSKLVKLSQSSKAIFPCYHKTFSKTLYATVLHELMHVKDQKIKISESISFQGLIGVKRLKKLISPRILNKNLASSVDSYEFKSPKESLATNFEYYVLDPNFACRKPAYARFLNQSLNWNKEVSCELNTRILTQSSFFEDNYSHVANLSSDRIFEVHYLFASESSQIMSRWGHSMLRLIVCAPHRKEVGPECLKDISHHLVISYRALIRDQYINYAHGLRGKYPSQIFITRFTEISQEYNKLEFRDLYSVPLKLSNKELISLVYLTIERYWSYKSKYYFLTNNCGTELIKHLAYSLPEEKSRALKSLTPKGILRNILNRNHDLVDSNIVDKILFYPSLENSYYLIFLNLENYNLTLGLDFYPFMWSSNPLDRMKRYMLFFSLESLSLKEKKIILNDIIKMERFLLLKLTHFISNDIIEQNNLDSKAPTFMEQFDSFGKSPWNIWAYDYGSPLKSEFQDQMELFFKERKLEMLDFKIKQAELMELLEKQKPLDNSVRRLNESLKLNKWLNNLLQTNLGVYDEIDN
jgi:hypothetical protein